MGGDGASWARLASAITVTAAAVVSLVFSGLAYAGNLQSDVAQIPENQLTELSSKCLDRSGGCPPLKLIRLSERLGEGTAEERAIAIKLVKRAIEKDDQHPGAWTLLSYLETAQSGNFTPAAVSAMRQSIKLCPLCDNRDLLRWRFSFVLQMWNEVPEDIRMGAFEGADMLRWWHLDHDFIKDQVAYAKGNDIPFHEYRMRVDSPVRPEEVQRDTN